MSRQRAIKSLSIKRRSTQKVRALLLSGLLLAVALIAPVQTIFAVDPSYQWAQSSVGGVERRSWKDIASSTDGTKLVAVANSAYIHTSIDSGTTWVARKSSERHGWTAVTSSADGIKLVAVTGNNELYTSIDSGTTWTKRSEIGSGNWIDIASSADGSKLVAMQSGVYNYTPEGMVYSGGYIYTSTDSGVTWTQRDAPQRWMSVTSSADGTRLAAAVEGGYIYTSTDSGVTWTQRGTARGWVSLASSDDGMRLLGVSHSINLGSDNYYDNDIYVSNDGGVTWDARGENIGFGWQATAVSADGLHLAAAGEDRMRVSADGGITWNDRTEEEQYYWTALAYSADGSLLAGTHSYQAYIRTSTNDAVDWATNVVVGDAAWEDVLTSSDGSVIFLQDGAGYVQRSIDGGNSWVMDSNLQEKVLWSIAMSGDGSNLIAICDYILCTSTDGGVTWLDNDPTGNGSWETTSISADGATLAGGEYGGYLHISPDGGDTWEAQTSMGTQEWGWIGLSADGETIIGMTYDGKVYRSINHGSDWVSLTIPGVQDFITTRISSDGTTIAIVNSDNEFYISTDSGDTWVKRAKPDSQQWTTLAMSANGQYIISASDLEEPWISTDKGVTWSQYETGSLSNRWGKVAITTDGAKVFAAEYPGNFYVGNLIIGNDETPPQEETPTPPTTQPPVSAVPSQGSASNAAKTTPSSTTTADVVSLKEETMTQPVIDLMDESTFRSGDEYKVEVTSGQVLSFKANDAPHTFTVDNVQGNRVTFTIRSTPQTHTLRVGETGKYDVDGDKADDISVTVNDVMNGVAQLTMVNLLATDVSVLSMPQEEASDTTEAETTKSGFNYGLIAWIAGGVVALLIAILIIRKTKRA